MTLPPCPWCSGERIEDEHLFERTGVGCSVCFTELGFHYEPREHPLTSALDGSGVDGGHK